MHRIIQVSLHINSWPFLVSGADLWSRKADDLFQNQSYKVMLQDWKGNSCSSSSEWHLKCKFLVWVLLFVWSNTLIPFKNGAALSMCRWGIRVRMLKLLSLKKHLGFSKGVFCKQEGAVNSRKCCPPLRYCKNHYVLPLISVSVGLLISLCLLNSTPYTAWGL